MWQVAVAAAVAGSGLLAKRLFTDNSSATAKPESPESDVYQEPKGPTDSPDSPQIQRIVASDSDSAPVLALALPIGYKGQISEDPDGIFRFSSSGRQGPRFGSKKGGVLGKNVGKGKKVELSGGEGGSGKRVCVCLKKRRIGKGCSIGKKSSSCCCKVDSSFNWGLGLGIMCMMSAGKAEIGKLTSALDETTRTVEEIKGEICKRKSSIHQHSSSLKTHHHPDPPKAKNSIMDQANTDSSKLDKGPSSMKVATPVDECEYASSVLTEEPPPHSAEMDLLEAELESELEKLPLFATEASQDGSNEMGYQQVEVDVEPKHDTSTYQFGGVSPAILSQKLSRVLIEQQETQISELESELNSAYSKLEEKEAELQGLKDCVKRLTEFSLSAASDEEKGSCREQGATMELDQAESRRLSGAKRSMNFGPLDFSSSCDAHKNVSC